MRPSAPSSTPSRFTAEEQRLLDAVERDRLWRDTVFLGSMYRKSGSDEERHSVQYIVDQLQTEGIAIEVFELDAFLGYHVAAKLEVLALERRTIPAAARSYTEPAPEGIEAEMVVAGSGQGERTGKAVLATRDWPHAHDLKGARVEIHAQTTEEPYLHRGGGTGSWGTPTPEQAATMRPGTTGIGIARPDGGWWRAGRRATGVEGTCLWTGSRCRSTSAAHLPTSSSSTWAPAPWWPGTRC